jgi:hypothetical protein
MADLGAIKADLKTWERAFKATHGREPRKDDIKADADICASRARSLCLSVPAPDVPRLPDRPSSSREV